MKPGHKDTHSLYMEMEATTSPWTELYQRCTPTRPTASPASQANHAQATRMADTESSRPTHDALSTIFNGR